MYSGEIISTNYVEVSPDHAIGFVIDKINELHYHQLPVIQGTDFFGLVQEEDLLAADNDLLSIDTLQRTFPFIFVYDYQHIYEASQIMGVHGFDVLPVLDKDRKYIGVITKQDIIHALNTKLCNHEPGAIIVLEMDTKDYSLSQIAHIIEAENARILSVSTTQMADDDRVEICLKLNKTNISAVTASLWRFNYIVKATFNDGSDEKDINDRYQLLMNYLDI